MPEETRPTVKENDTAELTVKGIIEDVVFQNAENGYTICIIDADGEPVTLTGIIPCAAEGELISAKGTWVNHPTYGKQFSVTAYSKEMPATSAAILTYLSSGAVKGIGPVTAQRIVDIYGEESLSVIEEHPEWLADIKGISPKKAKEISESFKNQYGMRQVLLYFQGMLTPNLALKVYKQWGNAAIDILRQNPYLLCDEIDGVGFERADTLAKSLGFQNDDEDRVIAGVKYVLQSELNRSGNCYLPLEILVNRAAEILGVSADAAKEGVVILSHRGEAVAVKYGDITAIYLENVYRTEKYCAEKLKLLCDTKIDIPLLDADAEIAKVESDTGIQFARFQADAIRFSTSEGVVIVTGGPGTGKTTVIRAIIQMFARLDIKVCLAAPTGRAAKRMTAATDMPAKTIHRLLECEYGADDKLAFQRNEDNPLDYGAVIVDEASMVDIFLFSALLRAMRPGTRLLLIGDADQLPPVGAGDVFGDLIKCRSFVVVRLDEIFRQGKDSRIITGAHLINHGQLPPLDNKGKDFFFMPRKTGAEVQALLSELCRTRLPKAYGFDALSDIQIICPSRKGEAGTGAINALMRELFNPPSPHKKEYTAHNTVFREGDKIMQIHNNYDIEWHTADGREGSGIFNGDIGFIENQTVCFRFDDDRHASCDLAAFDDIEHAYAITVHKSQGSEYRAVLLPLLDCPRGLMTRNMLYTAVTRAKSLVILIGKQTIMSDMIENNVRQNKYTGLSNMLKPVYVYPEYKMQEGLRPNDEQPQPDNASGEPAGNA